MKFTKIFVTLLLAAFLAPASLAGSPQNPEITDPRGDVSNAAVDVVSTWITSDASNVYFHIVVASLANNNPLQSTDTRYDYRVDFNVDGLGAVYADGQVHFADTSKAGVGTSTQAGVCVCAGTSGNGPGTFVGASLDTSSNTITLTMSRDIGAQSGHPTHLASGTFLDNIVVTTGTSTSPVMPTPSTTSVLGPAFTRADTTVPGGYTLN